MDKDLLLTTVNIKNGFLPFYKINENGALDYNTDFPTQYTFTEKYIPCIPCYIFKNCNANITSISFANLRKITPYLFDHTFAECTKLASLTFPEVRQIEKYGFYYPFFKKLNSNLSLTSLSFPKATDIDPLCFYYISDSFDFTATKTLKIHLPSSLKAVSLQVQYTNFIKFTYDL